MLANCERAPRDWVPTRERPEQILLELAPRPQLRRDLPPVAELTEVATVILDKQLEELLACALESAGVRTLVAAANIEDTKRRKSDD